MLIEHRIGILFCSGNDLNKSPIWLMSQVQFYSPSIFRYQLSSLEGTEQERKKKKSTEVVFCVALNPEICSIILAWEVGPQQHQDTKSGNM